MSDNRFVKLSTLSASFVAILFVCCAISSQIASSEQIKLSSILPRLQAIHEDTKSLLLTNSELKAKIQVGAKLQQSPSNQQNIKNYRTSSTIASLSDQQPPNKAPPAPGLTVSSAPKPVIGNPTTHSGAIDYLELGDFNEWVDLNLDYAVKNTKASIDALKEEAQQNNGTIAYSDQAVQDGIEGVKYWQSAVIFQDKTLKNEKYVVED